ncbi:DNA alkylation repair protein [Spiroplasma endosymbiont of Polydrusus pterygomalis]|uniref:DNA alkylation repair protein n=1 Tax=Spiroplasma endosymbiont of Polydrusus pterygomalis TaxID=3139327 RepID=UPI003CCAEDE7
MKIFNEEIAILTTIFINNADINVKSKQEKFLVNNFQFYGILTSKRKPLVKSLLNKWNKTLPLAIKKELFRELYLQKNREFQYTAMEFLSLWWKQNLNFNDLDWLLLIIKHNIWWDTTDYFDNIIGVLIFSNSDISIRNQYLFKLINDSNFWMQRIAIQTQLMFKEKTNFDLLFTLITPLLLTPNFYLIRAIGWALRNAKRVNESKVNNFIKINNVSKKIISVINEH